MKSSNDFSGTRPLEGCKPVEKTEYVRYKWGTGEETVDTKCNPDKKSKE